MADLKVWIVLGHPYLHGHPCTKIAWQDPPPKNPGGVLLAIPILHHTSAHPPCPKGRSAALLDFLRPALAYISVYESPDHTPPQALHHLHVDQRPVITCSAAEDLLSAAISQEYFQYAPGNVVWIFLVLSITNAALLPPLRNMHTKHWPCTPLTLGHYVRS